jgi:hypothetical protein
MSARDVAALASCVIPTIVLVLTLYGPWRRHLIPILQGSSALAAEILALTARHHSLAQVIAVVGFMIALVGLVAVLCRERWIARRVRRLVRWENFERDFHAYVDSASKRHEASDAGSSRRLHRRPRA